MKNHFGLASVLGSSAAVLMAVQPANAAATQVTGVQVNPTEGGVEVILQTRSGDRPQIFTINRGNALVADITNTQLQLPQGSGFLRNNPADGISSVVLTQLDANSVRLTVTGNPAAPTGQINQRRDGIAFSFTPSNGAAATNNAPSNGALSNGALSNGAPAAPRPVPAPVAQAPTPPEAEPVPRPRPPITAPAPNVLIPNPQITVEGLPANAPGRVPPNQPRAIAPPLGDIAVSTLDTSPEAIELGTNERVPRLVLRDAPVRDVLSLLARAAGLNVAYITQPGGEQQPGQAPAQGQAGQQPPEQRISLDIENEPVESVFNYVLRISGLQANRVGQTIFVGTRLPDEARGVVARTLRMNQINATDAANYLTAQGAETQIPNTRIEITTVGEGAAARTIESRTPEILPLRAQEGTGPLLLRGLSVLIDSRLNLVTLVGAPRKVELASAMLAQLDLRRRQVAVNVKVVDINLLATEDFSTSFSFGVGDSFFTVDQGAALFNFGGVRPPSQSDITNSRLTPPITGAPFPPGIDDIRPFQDAQPDAPFGIGDPQSFSNPALNDGSIQIPGGTFVRPPFGTNSNPLQGGVVEIDPAGRITVGLPQLFQYPTRFLASLQAQVQSGNAKILTDPTLVIQEGQTASVRLAQEVITNTTITRTDTPGGTREEVEFEKADAGLNMRIELQRIDDNGFVTLRVQPVVTAPTETISTEGGDITLLSRRELDSGFIRLRDSQTLIVSGIIQDSDRTTVRKVPLLGDIPILGALFRSTERDNRRQEVVILLTPQVVDDSERSGFGYSYTPGQETQEFLQRRGIQFP